MGTRNLTIVKNNNKLVVAQYGQYDGYPEGNGCLILNFLKKKTNIKKLKKNIKNCNFIMSEEESKKIEEEYGNILLQRYPQFSIDMGAKILDFIANSNKKEIKLVNDIDFISDSLFCEWAYIIDLDNDVLEIYKGFNEEKLTNDDKFYEFENLSEGGYHPCKFIASWSFDNLPKIETDFVRDIYNIVSKNEDN